MAERLLDYDPLPFRTILFGQLGRAEVLDYNREKLRTRGEIEETVATSVLLLLRLAEGLFQFVVKIRIVEITRHVIDALDQPFPRFQVDATSRKLSNVLRGPLAEVLGRILLNRDSDNRKLLRQHLPFCEIVDR